MSGAASVLPAAAAHPLDSGQATAETCVDRKSTFHTTHSTTSSTESRATALAADLPPQPPRSTSATRDHARSPAREESRRTIRRRSLGLVAEANGDVEEFVREMDEKRKLLDDQIHKFIAQKEREFKRYEQEMRTKYRTSHPPRLSPDTSVSSSLTQSASGHITDVSQPDLARYPSGSHEVRGPGNLRSRIDRRTANSGLEDVRPSHEREKDFMGLFTPAFLPLLDGKPELNRSPSAPSLTEAGTSDLLQPDRSILQRSNTEPLLDADGNRRPGYGMRTPSSGSEGLISALKTSGAKKNPKPMRVMLQLADDQPAVHPADDLPTERGYAPVREAEAMHHSKRSENPKIPYEDRLPSSSPSPPPLPPKPVDALPLHDPSSPKRSSLTHGLTMQSSTSPVAAPTAPDTPSVAKMDDLGDLASPFPLDEEVGEQHRPEPDWEVDFEENAGIEYPNDFSPSPAGSPEIANSPFDMSPDPGVLSTSNTTSGLKIRSSSTSSNQPISPGFSRPSVREDPILESSTAELEDGADVVGQGSLYDAFTRQSYSSRNTMSGSLGESFMQRNAENMMRRRRS